MSETEIESMKEPGAYFTSWSGLITASGPQPNGGEVAEELARHIADWIEMLESET